MNTDKLEATRDSLVIQWMHPSKHALSCYIVQLYFSSG